MLMLSLLPGPQLQPLWLLLADKEPERPACEQQEEHLAALSYRHNTCHFFSDSLSGEEGSGTNRCRFSSLFCCLYILFTHSLTLMLIVVHEDDFSLREIGRHGEPDKHNPYPQRPYHVIRKREIKERLQ